MSIISIRSLNAFLFALAGVAALSATAPVQAQANNYPNKTITLITPFGAGSPFDSLGRVFAERLSKNLKTSVVIENATGGQAMVATKKVLNAPADGYTLFYTSNGLATTPIVIKDAGYTLEDFTPIAHLGQAPYILFASASVKATDIPSLMKELKERGKAMNHGVLGTSHLGLILAKKISATAGGDPYQEISYRASPEMIRALLADDIQLMATTYSIAGPHLKDGKIKAIGVVAREKSIRMPELKTFIEAGYPDLYTDVWAALYTKAQTPKEIVEILRKAAAEVTADPSFQEAMKPTGSEAWNTTVDKMQAAFAEEGKSFAQAIEKFNLKLN
ncbi:MAG: tripartite tricarboxylate transporter substrate binding protein [Alcaligenaceae bacterium]